MGYRNYIASIPREEWNKIKNFSKEELFKYKNEDLSDEGHVGVYDVATKRIYELGKYVDTFPKKFFKPVFTNKELQKYFTEENDFYLVGRRFLEAVINDYALKIKNYYNDLLKDFLTNEKYPRLKDPKEANPESVYKALKHIESMAFEWGCSPFSDNPPYELYNGEAVTNSWKYEYAQFELVRIYKTFDWKKNVLIYYGY